MECSNNLKSDSELYDQVAAYSMDSVNNCAVTHTLVANSHSDSRTVLELVWCSEEREYLGFRAC